MENWPLWLSWAMSAFLFLTAGLNIVGAPVVLEQFARWGLPPWFRFVNAATQGVIGVLIVLPATRPVGLLLGVLDCAAMFVVLGRKRDFGHFGPGIVLLILLIVDAYGFGLIG